MTQRTSSRNVISIEYTASAVSVVFCRLVSSISTLGLFLKYILFSLDITKEYIGLILEKKSVSFRLFNLC